MKNHPMYYRWQKLVTETFGSNGKIAIIFAIDTLRGESQRIPQKLCTLLLLGPCGTGKSELSRSATLFTNAEYLSCYQPYDDQLKKIMNDKQATSIVLDEYTDCNVSDYCFKVISDNAAPFSKTEHPMIVMSQEKPLLDDGYLLKHCFVLHFFKQDYADFQKTKLQELRIFEKTHKEDIRKELTNYLSSF